VLAIWLLLGLGRPLQFSREKKNGVGKPPQVSTEKEKGDGNAGINIRTQAPNCVAKII